MASIKLIKKFLELKKVSYVHWQLLNLKRNLPLKPLRTKSWLSQDFQLQAHQLHSGVIRPFNITVSHPLLSLQETIETIKDVGFSSFWNNVLREMTISSILSLRLPFSILGEDHVKFTISGSKNISVPTYLLPYLLKRLKIFASCF